MFMQKGKIRSNNSTGAFATVHWSEIEEQIECSSFQMTLFDNQVREGSKGANVWWSDSFQPDPIIQGDLHSPFNTNLFKIYSNEPERFLQLYPTISTRLRCFPESMLV